MSVPISRRQALTALAAVALARVGAARADQAPVVTSLTLFGGNEDGLWRSRDWGLQWERVRPEALDELGAVHVVRPVGPRVYVGGSGGLFVSEDFGETYKRRAELRDVRALLTTRYPEADPTLFAGTGAGLSKSPDDGRTFSTTSVTGLAVQGLEWPGPALFVATARGLVVSDDGLATQRAPVRGLPEAPVLALALSSYFTIDPVVFAGLGDEHGVYRSADGGRTWSASGLQGRSVRALVWMGALLYAGTSAGVHRSQDAGRTWTRCGEGLGEREVLALLFPLAPDSAAEAFAATPDGIYHTMDGGLRWERRGKLQVLRVLATFPAPDPVQKKRR